MKLIIIPGAYSSHISWCYFEQEMPDDIERIFLDYNPENPLEDIIKSFTEILSKIDDNLIVVGHSLGGIIALNLSNQCSNIKKVITNASPFGGILISRWMVYVSLIITPFNNIWSNTHADNSFLTCLRNKNPKVETKVFIVETQNSTMWWEPSDGIVTVASQKALGKQANIEYKFISGTHADAMLHPDFISYVAKIIKS